MTDLLKERRYIDSELEEMKKCLDLVTHIRDICVDVIRYVRFETKFLSNQSISERRKKIRNLENYLLILEKRAKEAFKDEKKAIRMNKVSKKLVEKAKKDISRYESKLENNPGLAGKLKFFQ